MPKPHDRIGPYELIRKLGKGAFGEVWLAHDVDNLVARAPAIALKLPLDDDVDLDAIRQEATVWVAASGHANVLPMLEARLYDGQVVIASEYAPDGSLQQWLKTHGGKAPTQAAALEMTRGILAGLSHLHSRRIVHRDLKPDNILLKGTTPRLADFGLSRVLRSTSMSAVVAGTPVYMAPEAFKGKRNPQSDLWSVGVMLYQLLSGRFPFLSNDKYELYVRITNDEPAPIEAPPWLQQVVSKALSKDLTQRFQTAEEMLDALAEQERQEVERRKEQNQLETEQRQRAEAAGRQRQQAAEGERQERPHQQAIEAIVAAEAMQRRANQTTQLDQERTELLPQPSTSNKFVWLALAAALLLALSYWGWRQQSAKVTTLTNVLPISLGQPAQNEVVRGQPAQIEVAREKLNVRNDSNRQSTVIGVIQGGTRHRVLDGDEQGWLHIEVSKWDASEPHRDERQGWIYVPGNAIVTERR